MLPIAQALAKQLSREGQGLFNLPSDRIVGLFDQPTPPKRRTGSKQAAELLWSDDDNGRSTALESSNKANNNSKQLISVGQIALKLSKLAVAFKEAGLLIPWESQPRLDTPTADQPMNGNKAPGNNLVAQMETECDRIVSLFKPTDLIGSCSRHFINLNFHLSGEAFLKYMMDKSSEIPVQRTERMNVTVVYPGFPASRALTLVDLRFVAAAIHVSRQLASSYGCKVTLIAIPDSEKDGKLEENLSACREIGATFSPTTSSQLVSLPASENILVLHQRGTKSDLLPLLSSRDQTTVTRMFIGKTSWVSPGDAPGLKETLERFIETAVEITKEKQSMRLDDPGFDEDDDEEKGDLEPLSKALAKAALLFPFQVRSADGETNLSETTFAFGNLDEPDSDADAGGVDNQHGATSTNGIFILYVLSKLSTLLAAPPHASIAKEEQILPRELLPAFLHLSRAPHCWPVTHGQSIALFSGTNSLSIPESGPVARHLYMLASLISSATYSVRIKDVANDNMREGRRSAFAALKTGVEVCCRLVGMDPAGVGTARM